MLNKYYLRKLEDYVIWIVLIILLILLIIIILAIVYNNPIVNTTPLSNVIYVILGSILSGIITITWNVSFAKRADAKEKKEKEELKINAYGEILSALAEIASEGIQNLEVLRTNELYLHFLQTGFWEKSISSFQYNERDQEDFTLLMEIHLNVNLINRIIADRERLILEKTGEVGLINDMDAAIIKQIKVLNKKIAEYMKYVNETITPINLKNEIIEKDKN